MSILNAAENMPVSCLQQPLHRYSQGSFSENRKPQLVIRDCVVVGVRSVPPGDPPLPKQAVKSPGGTTVRNSGQPHGEGGGGGEWECEEAKGWRGEMDVE